MPDYWEMQYNLLIVLKSIFDRVKPRSATVIFEIQPLQYPTGDAEALFKLTRIETLHQGIQLWNEYVIQANSLQYKHSDWQNASYKTPEGYRFNIFGLTTISASEIARSPYNSCMQTATEEVPLER